MQVTTIGLGPDKRPFQIQGVDAVGGIVLRRLLQRCQVEPFFAKLPRCLVGIEACGTAHVGWPSSATMLARSHPTPRGKRW